MRRISTPTAAADLFGPGKHGFRNGDPANAILATRLQAEWFNALQEEVSGLVEGAGIELNAEDNTQLLNAIRRLRGGQGSGLGFWAWSVATSGDPGTGRVALNHATPASATKIFVSESSGDGMDYALELGAIAAGDTVYLRSISGSIAHRFRVTGAATDSGAYREVPVVYASGAGGAPAANDVMVVRLNQTTVPSDVFDAARIDVASAATVDLTALAPSTRAVRITGNTAISGFSVQAGKRYFVTFAGTVTLNNSANLITQRGANITTQPGATCIVQALADNVVEILGYTGVYDSFRGCALITASGTLSVAHVGMLVMFYTVTTLVTTLPLWSSVNVSGATIRFYNNTSLKQTIARQGTDTFGWTNNGGGSLTSIDIPPGCFVDISAGPAAGSWYVTADNVSGSIGVDQTYQDVTGSRAVNTTYTNTTGRAIEVQIYCGASAGVQGFFQVDGIDRVRMNYSAGASASTGFSCIIPPGSTYRLNTTSLTMWEELRK